MTQPIQEPSHDRSMQSANWGVRQLFRRPAQSLATGGTWGIVSWFDGHTINWSAPWGDNWIVDGWDEAYVSDQAIFDASITPNPAATELGFDILESDGGLWVIEVAAEIIPDSGFSDVGDVVGLGNLVNSGPYNDDDVYHFEEANEFMIWGSVGTQIVCQATRVFPAGGSMSVSLEIINSMVTSNIDIFVNQAQISAWRPSPGEGTLFISAT